MFTNNRKFAANTFFAPHRFLDDHGFVTKMGEVGIHGSVEGIDFECRGDKELEEFNHTLTTALSQMPEEIRYFSYLLKTDGVELPEETIENEIARKTVEYRNHFLQTSPVAGATTVRLYLTFLYEPPKGLRGKAMLTKYRTSKKKIIQCYKTLLSAVRAFMANTGALLGFTIHPKEEVFRWFRFLASFDKEVAEAETLEYDNGIDHWMASNVITPLKRGLAVNGRTVEVLSMRKPPKKTWPNVIGELLKVPGDFLLCSQFRKEPDEKVVSHVHSLLDHLNFVKYAKNWRALAKIALHRGETEGMVEDASVVVKTSRADAVLKSVAREESLGRYRFTAFFFSKDAMQLESTVNQAVKIVGKKGGSLVRESGWSFGVYMTVIPGTTPKWNDKWQKRRYKFIYTRQFPHLGFFYNYRSGHAQNTLTGRPSLLTVQRTNGALYRMNLVPPKGNRKQALLFGEPGSGKSVLMQMLIDHSQKDNPYTLVMDGMGGSFRTLTAKHKGFYFDLYPEGEDWKFTLNPFRAFPDSAKTRQYLSTLIRSCMAAGKFKEDAKKNQTIYKEICRVLELPEKKRRISSLKLPAELDAYLEPWKEGNQYGFVFDNPEDTFSVSRLQTIDFSYLSDFADLMGPLFMHFFAVWDRVVYDPKLLTTEKDMYIDEGWSAIAHTGAYIKKSLRTWRKRLGGMVFGSQSIEELKELGALDLIKELCPVKILMANPTGKHRNYASEFGLNAATVAQYAQLREPGSAVYVSSDETVTFKNVLDPLSYWTYTNQPFDNAKRDRVFKEHGMELGLELLAAGMA